MIMILDYSLINEDAIEIPFHPYRDNFSKLGKVDISDGNTKTVNSPIFCNLEKLDFARICSNL